MHKRADIDSFTKSAGYDYLSNFYPSTIYLDGKSYPTAEHAYWAYATTDLEVREAIRTAVRPGEARRAAKTIELRADWEEYRIPHLRRVLTLKFDNPLLLPRLLSTQDADLIFKNTWGDTLLGVCKGVGENWLGRILMELRTDLPKRFEEEYTDFQYDDKTL
jgi:ribA/ribD-fused uncharacterized protein